VASGSVARPRSGTARSSPPPACRSACRCRSPPPACSLTHGASSPIYLSMSVLLLLRTAAGSTPLLLGRESFAVACPLALLGSASYPISFRRLADSLPAFFSAPVTLGALRFAWIATTNSPGDSHPRGIRHAGHTYETTRTVGDGAGFSISRRHTR
jgi:hypothetical protein